MPSPIRPPGLSARMGTNKLPFYRWRRSRASRPAVVRARFSSRPLSLPKMTLPRMEEALTTSFQTDCPLPSSSAASTKRLSRLETLPAHVTTAMERRRKPVTVRFKVAELFAS